MESVTIDKRKEGRQKGKKKEGGRDSGRCSPLSGSRVNSRDSVFFLVRSLHSLDRGSALLAHRYMAQLYNLVSILSLCYRNERDPFIARATRFLRSLPIAPRVANRARRVSPPSDARFHALCPPPPSREGSLISRAFRERR